MSTWRLVIEFEWPDVLATPAMTNGRDRPRHMQDILFEALEPLNRENVEWHAARFELARDSEGNY